VDYLEVCDGPGQCKCGLFCNAGTLTCSFYGGENRGCLCNGEPVSPPGHPLLGIGTHSISDVDLTVIGTASNGLKTPRDLEFDPESPGDLWVVNRATPGDERMVVFRAAGTDKQKVKMYTSPSVKHFFAQPSAFAFGLPNELATVHETNDLTQGPEGPGRDFMGPTLQSTDLGDYDAGGGGHLDMLHNTPLGMGVAWEKDRVYWIFDGYHSSLTRYNFNSDHGPGGEDHSDGAVYRYVEDEVKRKADVPSHMEFDPSTSLLYVADTGNNRIAVLDTTTGKSAGSLPNNYDKDVQLKMKNADLWTLIDGATAGLSAPSGLALHEGLIFVTDNENSKVFAFDMGDGTLIDWLETGLPPGSLMGITFAPDGSLWLVDAVENRILRIAAKF
jgi:DNA-binding beta-propeller fold protein YncE